MSRVVVDASALLVASTPLRPDAARAFAQILAEHEVVAPRLLVYEIGNVVLRKRPDEFGRSLADRLAALDAMLDGVLVLPTEAGDLAAAARVAEEERLSFYDACYLELAERGDDVALLTLDARLAEAGRRRLGRGKLLALPGPPP